MYLQEGPGRARWPAEDCGHSELGCACTADHGAHAAAGGRHRLAQRRHAHTEPLHYCVCLHVILSLPPFASSILCLFLLSSYVNECHFIPCLTCLLFMVCAVRLSSKHASHSSSVLATPSRCWTSPRSVFASFVFHMSLCTDKGAPWWCVCVRQVVDVMLFLVDAEEGIDRAGDYVLTLIKAQVCCICRAVW